MTTIEKIPDVFNFWNLCRYYFCRFSICRFINNFTKLLSYKCL